MNFPSIYFKETPARGRGVFSANEIEENIIIEKCPVIIISTVKETNLIACTSLINYAFRWNADPDMITIALGYGSLYNHSSAHNAFYKMNTEENSLDIISIKRISTDEEITINYSGSTQRDAKKWFEDRGIEYIE